MQRFKCVDVTLTEKKNLLPVNALQNVVQSQGRVREITQSEKSGNHSFFIRYEVRRNILWTSIFRQFLSL